MAMAAGKEAGFLEPTFQRAARIWWAWVWRSLVFGGAAGLFASATLSVSGILEHVSEQGGAGGEHGVRPRAGSAHRNLGVPVDPGKNFGEFRLRLVPKAATAPPAPPPPIDETIGRADR